MVIAHHLIWTVYGTWLPNDPRGSGSETVACPKLATLGELHYGRRKNQPGCGVVRQFYERAEPRLLFPVIRFNARKGNAIGKHNYTCYACAVMPDHVHLVIRKHRDAAEKMVDNLQDLTRASFLARGKAPVDHPVWTLGGCKRFLDSPQRMRIAIRYVKNNPGEIGLPRQNWPFVTPYDNWPFHNRSAPKRT